MIDPHLDEAPAGSWWSRLTQAVFREPSVVLLEKEADSMHPATEREEPLRPCEAAQ